LRSLTERASFWTAGAVVALALWTSACPTMIYPLYQADWAVTSTTVAWIFAAYPIALIPVLVVFGDLSDHIGRRATILLGLAAELIGVLLFVLARDVAWLLVGRAFMGLGVGLSLSPASVAMVEFSAPGAEKRAGAVGTAVSAFGIALAMLVGGGLSEYGPYPLRLTFVVVAVVIVVVAVIALGLPRHTPAETRSRWRVRPIIIPRGNRGIFAAGSIAFASSFVLGSLVLPLGAKIAHQLAGSDNALITGALLSVFAVSIAVTALLAKRLDSWTTVVLGAIFSAGAVWLFVVTGTTHSIAVFFVASACAGIGYSFDFASGLTILNRYAAPHHRASMVSGGYLVGYLSQGIGAPALGAIVTAHGLMTGLRTGAIAFSVVFAGSLAGALLVGRSLRRARPENVPVGESERAVGSANTLGR
jgi:MFS family permease